MRLLGGRLGRMNVLTLKTLYRVWRTLSMREQVIKLPLLVLCMLTLFTLLFLAKRANAQVPSQVKQILPTATSVTFAWDYNTTDEASIDSFVIQRTAFA